MILALIVIGLLLVASGADSDIVTIFIISTLVGMFSGAFLGSLAG